MSKPATLVRGISGLVVALAVVFVFAACGGSDDGSSEETVSAGSSADDCETRESVKLQLQWTYQAQFAGFLAADDQGFYDAECIDIEILPGGPDVSPEQVVAGGGAEFGSTLLSRLLAQRAEGMDFVNIGQIYQRTGTRYISFADAGIASFADLKGRTAGAWGFGNDIMIRAAMTRAGLDPRQDVDLIDQPFDVSPLLERDVDAIQAMVYNEYAQLLETEDPETGELYQPEDFTVLDLNEAGVGMMEDLIFARESWVNDNEELAARFVRGSLRGWIYCRDNPEDCVESVLNRGTVLGTTHQMWQMNEVNKLIWPSPDKIGWLTEEDFERTDEIAVEYIDTIDEPQPYEDVFRADIVERAWEGMDEDLVGEDFEPITVELTAGGQ